MHCAIFVTVSTSLYLGLVQGRKLTSQSSISVLSAYISPRNQCNFYDLRATFSWIHPLNTHTLSLTSDIQYLNDNEQRSFIMQLGKSDW